MPLTYAVLLCLHLLAAAFWVGGMATMHFAVRPAAVTVLEPPARLAFLTAALGRFFAAVAAAIGVLLASGVAMIVMAQGAGRLHWRIHAMVGIGLLMVGVFGHIRFGAFAKLRRAVAAREFAPAAAVLVSIRRGVALNLALGVAVFAVALIGRAY